ncbi:hypothetical protein [Halarcobacter ebronensis]|uniref:SPOR domain-containing protein n=1 Tax=Halarcobacter ebronensis TaxID=1462615 RepID=A0A4Q1AT39_9BACT|nr:hypothetical protein [Halarcobacter ebronensis]QKF82917.1 hypothetical protein AEBR_2450 [Halarcobacter ebronensis]RXK06933.1 hypothetical protein CRV07_05760 [Halarcobacter ebronensis]
MKNKSDEEIIDEIVGSGDSESKEPTNEADALAKLSIRDDKRKNQNDESDDELEPVLNENSKSKSANKENVIENEDKDGSLNNSIDEEDFPIQKKQPKIFKVLIAIAALLSVVLLIGIILYFSGFFDPKPVVETKVVKEIKKVEPEVVFNENDINKKELNKKLNMLTKKEIMSQEELEAEEKKIEEEKKRKEEEMQKEIEEKKKEEELKLANQLTKIQEEKKALEEQQLAIKQQQEEFLKLQEEAKKELEEKKNQILNGTSSENKPAVNAPAKEDTNSENPTTDVAQTPQEDNANTDENSAQTQEQQLVSQEQMPKEEATKIVTKSFLSFINVATIKGELFKTYLDDIEKYNKNISLCRDTKNNIEIYFGPFDSQNEREKVFSNLMENGYKDAYLVDFTAEEYNKRCKY